MFPLSIYVSFDNLCLGIVLIQSQEGGAPGHQCGSSAGAAGPGHEPQSAHLPGPGCRAYPGKRKVFSLKSFPKFSHSISPRLPNLLA